MPNSHRSSQPPPDELPGDNRERDGIMHAMASMKPRTEYGEEQ